MKYLLFVVTSLMSLPLFAQEAEPELIPIHKVDYERNPKASFCTRPIEMVDTVVIHHSQGAPTATPEEINELHLNRGTPQEPWYMIAYSYVVNTPYPNKTVPVSKVSEGRPLDLVGAHAGSDAFVAMDEEQQRMWNEGKVLCGPASGGEFKVDPKQIKNGKIKANVTTIGVVVNGNYAKFSRDNPTGWTARNPRWPTDNTQDMLARVSCQLQKKYPRMKYLRWHNFYHSTDCPGNIKDHIAKIRTLAKGYGCDFN